MHNTSVVLLLQLVLLASSIRASTYYLGSSSIILYEEYAIMPNSSTYAQDFLGDVLCY